MDKDDSWVNVAKGRKYSHRYGFGKLDTAQILSVAKGFTNVGPQTSISPTSVYVEQTIPHGNDGLASTITISQADVDSAKMLRMEHVTVTVSISHQRRGEVQVWLTSPSGYVSILATARRYDHSVIGFRDWTFMSVKHW